MRRRPLFAAFAALGLAAALASRPASGATAPGEDWQARTEAVVAQLQAGEWAAAESGASAMLAEMVSWIAGGQGAARSLALLTTFRALAEAGLGRLDDAVWHWQVAQQIAPEISAMDLRPFGAAGAALLGDSPRSGCAGAATAAAGGIVKPRAVERPRPSYPDALRAAGVHGTVTVEAVIGIDGVPRQPRLLSPEAPASLVLAAAEALRASRFAPARRGGEPMPYCYASSTRFELVEAPRR